MGTFSHLDIFAYSLCNGHQIFTLSFHPFFLPSFLHSFLLMILFYTRNVCLNKMLGDAIATIAN